MDVQRGWHDTPTGEKVWFNVKLDGKLHESGTDFGMDETTGPSQSSWRSEYSIKRFARQSKLLDVSWSDSRVKTSTEGPGASTGFRAQAYGPATWTRLSGRKLLCVDVCPANASIVVGGESGFLAVLPRGLARTFGRASRPVEAPLAVTPEQSKAIAAATGRDFSSEESVSGGKAGDLSAPAALEPGLAEPSLPTGSVNLSGHLLDVNAARFIAGGGAVLSASSDMSVRVWSAGTGHCGAILRGHTGGVLDAVPLGPGRTVVSGGRDCTLRSWSVATAKNSGTWYVGGSVRAVEGLRPAGLTETEAVGGESRPPLFLYACESGGVTIEPGAQLAALSAPAGVGAGQVLRDSARRSAAVASGGGGGGGGGGGCRRWEGEGHVGLVDLRSPRVACRLLPPRGSAPAAGDAAGEAASGAGEDEDEVGAGAGGGDAAFEVEESFVAVAHYSRGNTVIRGAEAGASGGGDGSARRGTEKGSGSMFDVWGAAQSGRVFRWDLRVPSGALAVSPADMKGKKAPAGRGAGGAAGLGGGWSGAVLQGAEWAGGEQLRGATPVSLTALGPVLDGLGGEGMGSGWSGGVAVGCSDGLVRALPGVGADAGGGGRVVVQEVLLSGLDTRVVGGQAWAVGGRAALGVPTRRQVEQALAMARGGGAGAGGGAAAGGAKEMEEGGEAEEDLLCCCATVSHSGVLCVFRGVQWRVDG